jgi:hypothetical protein
VWGWQCAEDNRGVCDSGVWCDVGGGVDGSLRVCPRKHDEGRYDVSWLSPFGSVQSSIGFQRRPLGVGCERRDRHASKCAPRHIIPRTHVELSLALGWWFATCGVGNVRRTIGGCVIVVCGVTLVEAWVVRCACVHTSTMRVGMMCRGVVPFGSVYASTGRGGV